jgi:hypothetical protein
VKKARLFLFVAGNVKQNLTVMGTAIWNPIQPFKVGGEEEIAGARYV